MYSHGTRLKPDSIHFMRQTTTGRGALSKDLTDRLRELEQETGILQVGQEINKIFIRDNVAKQGIILSSIKEALTSHSEVIRSHMGANQLNYLEDKFLALEGSAFQSGIFIYIPRNVT